MRNWLITSSCPFSRAHPDSSFNLVHSSSNNSSLFNRIKCSKSFLMLVSLGSLAVDILIVKVVLQKDLCQCKQVKSRPQVLLNVNHPVSSLHQQVVAQSTLARGPH